MGKDHFQIEIRPLQHKRPVKYYYHKCMKNADKPIWNIIEKWAKNINRDNTGEEIHMDNKLMKRCSTSLRSQENTNKDHKGRKSIQMPTTKKFENSKYWRHCSSTESPMHFCWDCKLVQPLWKGLVLPCKV